MKSQKSFFFANFLISLSLTCSQKKDISLKESWREKAQKKRERYDKTKVSSRRIFNLCFPKLGGGLKTKSFLITNIFFPSQSQSENLMEKRKEKVFGIKSK